MRPRPSTDLRESASHGAGGQRGARAQAIGPSRGGQTTKIHALTDVLGRPGVLLLTPGNASDVTTAPAVLAEVPGRIRHLAADKGYDADWLRADLRDQGITPVIPGTRARKRKVRHDQRRYRERWRIEATINRLKDFRRIATRLTTSWRATMPRLSRSLLSSPSGADRVSTLEPFPIALQS